MSTTMNTTGQALVAFLRRLVLAAFIFLPLLYASITLSPFLADSACGAESEGYNQATATNNLTTTTTMQPTIVTTQTPTTPPSSTAHLTTSPSTTIPQHPQASISPHYQTYLANLESERPVIPREKEFPPNGVMCMLGYVGQLNNWLNSLSNLLDLCQHLNRTVVVPPLVSHLYDANYLERFQPFVDMMLPNGHVHHPSRVSMNQTLCNSKQKLVEHESSEPRNQLIERLLLPENIRVPVLAISAEDAFYLLKAGDMWDAETIADEFKLGEPRRMFSHLHPIQETREIAVRFVDEHFGDKPFVAVHLRFLDGSCYRRSNDLACDLDPQLLHQILKKNAPELVDAPIFVASDHQRPDLEALFTKAGAFFYRGKCHSTDRQCMVIDAEIAARSAYFYGLHASSAAGNIELIRLVRDNGVIYKQLPTFPMELPTDTGTPFDHIMFDESNISMLFDRNDPWHRHGWPHKEDPIKWFQSHHQSHNQVASRRRLISCHEQFETASFWTLFIVFVILVLCLTSAQPCSHPCGVRVITNEYEAVDTFASDMEEEEFVVENRTMEICEQA